MDFLKDFMGWNKDKIKIDQGLFEPKNKKFINIREIWDSKYGINVGSEVCGKTKYMRPVLIIKKIGSVYICLPLTTKGKNNHILYHKISSIDFGKDSFILMAHIKSLDPKRLIKRIGTIKKEEFLEITKKLQKLCFGDI